MRPFFSGPGNFLRTRGALFALVIAIGFMRLTAVAEMASPKAIQVLILTGQGKHDWRATTPFLREVLGGTGRFEVRVCESPVGLTAATLENFDVLVDDYEGPRWGETTEKAVQNFVKRGKGLVVVHGALASFNGEGEPAWAGFAEMTKVKWAKAPELGLVHFFYVKMANGESPVGQGMKEDYKVADEIHHGLTLSSEAAVVATAEDEPVVFASKYGKGRVFCTALGHEIAGMNEAVFITTLARGAEWAATGAVTLPAEIGLPQPETNAVRALLITGGHDHESAFNSLFDGYKDLDWVQESSSQMAFQNDLRGKYDLLILYDFSRDLDDKAKENLKKFVESGNGVLVLHHAILSYQKWPWWYQEVVGGLYRLSPEGDAPSSSVKANCEFFVTPAGAHPITDGVGPFHLWDETYKNMYISPDVKPLLFTDNPNSDKCIAWVSPYAKARVVFIQLGHGHTAFRSPAYRKLVHNAVLWVAGWGVGK